MTKRVRATRLSHEERDLLFRQADELMDAGAYRRAATLFLRAANAGDDSSQLNVGNLYSEGRGVRRDDTKALYWYRRAYRQGNASAASNIGLVYRDQGRFRLAIRWLERAIAMGDHDAALELGRIYMDGLHDPARAAHYLAIVTDRKSIVTEASREEAHKLLAIVKQANRAAVTRR